MVPWTTIIIEDQFLFRDLLIKLLDGDPRFQCVGSAGDGEEGLDLCLRMRPRLICLDLNMPRLGGLAMADRLRTEALDSRILALTSCKDEASIAGVLELGLAGYVEKDQPITVLEQALVAVAEGRTYFSPTFEEVRRRMGSNPDAVNKVLSMREREILRLVAGGRTSAEIAGELGLSERTVGNHRYNLMNKLGLRNAAEVVAYAMKQAQ